MSDKYGLQSGRDTVENLYARLERLELDIRRLKDTKRAAFDRGATASVPTPYEGQTIIQGTDIWYYAEGAWHTPGSGEPSYAYCYSYAAPQAVSATSSLTLAWEDFSTNDLTTVFSTGSNLTSGNNTTGDQYLHFHSAGYYLCYADIVWTDAVYERYFYISTTLFGFNQLEVPGGAAFPRDGVEPNNATALQERNFHGIVNTSEAAGVNNMRVIAYNRDSVSRDVRYATLAAVHWPMAADFAGTDVIY